MGKNIIVDSWAWATKTIKILLPILKCWTIRKLNSSFVEALTLPGSQRVYFW